MLQLIGVAIVLTIVIAGLWVSGGPAVVAALPFELSLICGAGIGTVLIGNAPSIARESWLGLVSAVRGPKWMREDYQALLVTLHKLTWKARKGGVLAIEADIEEPQQSQLFQSNPKLMQDSSAMALICDTLRLAGLDPSARNVGHDHMEERIVSTVVERQKAVSALHTLADALPALGIVAAVLGIIKTMGVIDQSPDVLGEMIAAALLGTFLGVFLAYGLIGPMANRFGQIVEEEALYLETIRSLLGQYLDGVSPSTSLESARAALPVHLRPELGELDNAIIDSRLPRAVA